MMTVDYPHSSLSRTHTAPSTMHGGRPANGLSGTRSTQFPGYGGGLSHSSTGMSQISSANTTSALVGQMTQTNGSQTGSSIMSPPLTNGRIMASDNIVNQLADSSKSLYQICRSLQQRLTEVPGFEEHLKENNYDDGNSEDDTDPVTSMWRCLRRGYPLMTIYNALNPPQRLEIDESKVTPANRPKKASFLFVNACLRDLNFPPDECFVITDLFGDDTTGFVKVTKVVSRVLDMLKERNLLRTTTTYDSDTETITDKSQKRTYRDHVVAELVDTERKYVQDLEVLQTFKKLVQESGAVAGDVIFTIFMNLNALLDFQRRFLIRVETTNTQPQDMQNWGLLFLTYEEAFRVYEPYIANQHKCTMTAEQEFENLKSVGHPITVDWTTFSGFLLKPVQRLTKYPLLLKDLRDKTDASPEQKADLNSGYEASQRVLERANDAVDRIVRAEAVDDLAVRVEDWKGHKIEQFGELLLYGTFTVVKGDGRNDVEREVGRKILSPVEILARNLEETRQGIELAAEMKRMGLSTGVAVVVPRSVSCSELPKRKKPEPLQLRRTSEDVSTPQLKSSGSFKSFFSTMLSPQKSGSFSPATPSGGRSPTTISGRSTPTVHGRMTPTVSGPNTPTVSGRVTPSMNGQSSPSYSFTSMTSPVTPSMLRYSQASNDSEESPVVTVPPALDSPSRKGKIDDELGLLEAYNINKEKDSAFKHKTVYLETLSKSTVYNLATKRDLLEEKYADEMGHKKWSTLQYKIYLFERILLCCKEYNPNKQKNKVMSMNKPTMDKKGKPKLQLKGRIFMQNVTDTLCLTKPGSYTVQIWWKGDPGVENFIIRFQSEETMKKWYNMVDRQVKIFQEAERRSGRTSTSTKTSDTEFAWQKNQGAPMENPYQQTDDGEDDDEELLYGSQDPTVYTPQSEFSMSRNASSTSLRSRSTTGDSGPPMAQVGYPGGLSRVPPSRFLPTNGSQPPPLTLLTHLQSNVAASPSERLMNSYFSPVVESPMSSRTSSSSGMYPFPRQATPSGSFHEEHNRFTAPAMGRTASRDGQSVSPVYQMNNRAVQRPSLPAMAPQVPMPQPPMTQNRMRSASSPDIHNPSGQPRRGLPNAPSPHPPMPPFPAHIAHINGAAGINRSQNNSPTTLPNMLPIRSATQSPGVQRERLAQQMYQSQYGTDPPRSDPRAPPPLRTGTSTASSVAESVSPTMTVSSQNSDGYQAAVQLKVKVTFLDNYVTLVVSSNIKYQSLANRIDHKLARSTTLSIGNGNLRLRYKDEDGDFVTIHSDDDIQMAITDWREQQRGNVIPAGMAEIQLYCQTIEN